MTNREWLQTLSTRELAEYIYAHCPMCVYDNNLIKCHECLCTDGIEAWLKQEHKIKLKMEQEG